VKTVSENVDTGVVPIHEATVEPDLLERADPDHGKSDARTPN